MNNFTKQTIIISIVVSIFVNIFIGNWKQISDFTLYYLAYIPLDSYIYFVENYIFIPIFGEDYIRQFLFFKPFGLNTGRLGSLLLVWIGLAPLGVFIQVLYEIYKYLRNNFSSN